MKRYFNYFGIMLIMMIMIKILSSCEESTSLVYYDKNAPAPQLVDASTITIENLPGKSVLTYVVPNDDNLLSVKAVYETSEGHVRQSHSSRYVDTLALEGFNEGGDYNVKLYSVGKNQKETGPINVTVSPYNSPIAEAFPSLNLLATFGGVEGSFLNEHEVPIKAVLLGDTANTGELVFINSYTIDNPEAQFSIRGLKNQPMRFQLYLMDRWGNKTEVNEYELTPMFEERLDKSLWKEFKLPSDFQNTLENNYPGYVIEGLWDDVIAQQYIWSNVFVPELRPLPATFTIDLGVTVKLSRFNFVPWIHYIWTGYPRFFEVYGSGIEEPGDDLDGGDWQLVGKFESYKPSGRPSGFTQADRDAVWPGGENWDIKPSKDQPDPYFPIRVIRFRVTETWSDPIWSIDELTIWGEIIN